MLLEDQMQKCKILSDKLCAANQNQKKTEEKKNEGGKKGTKKYIQSIS